MTIKIQGVSVLRDEIESDTYDSSTDNLQAIRDEIVVIDGEVGVMQTDVTSIETKTDALDAKLSVIEDNDGGTFDATTDSLEAIRNAIDAIQGTESYKVVSVTSAADAGFVTLGTVTTGAVTIQSVVIHADSAAQVDLTSCGVYGGAGGSTGPIEFINHKDAKKDNLDAVYEQVAWTGEVYLPVGAKIDMNLLGGGSTPVDLTVAIRFMSTSLATPGTLG